MQLVQVAQRAEDLQRATAFYADLLGVPPTATYDPPGLVFFDLAGTRLMLELNAPAAMLYLAVDDIDATIERLRGSGVTIEHEPHVIFSHADDTLGPAGTDEWQAFVRDSEGNLVGLVEQRPLPRTLTAACVAALDRPTAVADRPVQHRRGRTARDGAATVSVTGGSASGGAGRPRRPSRSAPRRRRRGGSR